MAPNFRMIIFDLDGTLVGTNSGKEFPENVWDRRWLPGRLDHLRALRDKRILTAVATNQGGAAFGYFLPQEFEPVIERHCREGLMAAYAVCYEHPDGTNILLARESERRKPNPGMLLELMRRLGVQPEDTLYVGDREEDREAARRAMTHFEWAQDYFED